MSNKKVLSIVVLVFVLLIGGASVLYRQLSQQIDTSPLMVQQSSQPAESSQTVENSQHAESVDQQQETEQKNLAPDFIVYDKDGNEVKLSDFIGKPVVLNFWATWCGYCKMEMPVFEEKYQQLGEDVEFLIVNLTDGNHETKEKATAYIEESGYTFPVYFDTQLDAAMKYGTNAIPVTYFIGADGEAIARASGAINAEVLQQGIDMISQ